MTYFQRTSWKLNDGSTMLDLDNFDDEMFYYVAMDSKFVANSLKEYRERRWPKATHYIAIENQDAEMKYSKSKRKAEAFKILEDKDMTPSMRRKVAVILGLVSPRASSTEEQTFNLLFDYIDATAFIEGSNIDKFEEVAALLKDKNGREEIEARFLLQQALSARVIYEKAGGYTWNRAKGPMVIGDTYTEAILFLMSPKKDALVQELTNEIQAKSKV